MAENIIFMKTNRRHFLETALIGSAAATLPGFSFQSGVIKERYAILDEIIEKPVLKKEQFLKPVIIESLELLRLKNSFLCRVRSKDGAVGLSVANNEQMKSLYPVFVNRLKPFFIGKDARNLETLLGEVYVYQSNYKMQNLALWVPLATIEFAILDMLGRMKSKSIGQLIGEIHNPKIAVYQANGERGITAEAIRIGKIMEEYKIDFYEEPVPFDWYDETKDVAGALKIPIAGGEQEPSIHMFRWLIANDALHIVQPDMFYFGGMIRSMKVARMAMAFGKQCTPHISGSGLGYLYMMHFVSAIPNAGPYHEFKGFNDELPFECKTSSLSSDNGVVTVPSGAGMGIEIDAAYISRHQVVN